MRAEQFDAYVEHLRRGGAPFGGSFNASIGEVVEGYQTALRAGERKREGVLCKACEGEGQVVDASGDDWPRYCPECGGSGVVSDA